MHKITAVLAATGLFVLSACSASQKQAVQQLGPAAVLLGTELATTTDGQLVCKLDSTHGGQAVAIANLIGNAADLASLAGVPYASDVGAGVNVLGKAKSTVDQICAAAGGTPTAAPDGATSLPAVAVNVATATNGAAAH